MNADAECNRYAACVEYDGTAFSGWQKQPHARSVQGDVEKALACVAANAVVVTCAGRTDTGVHATGQIIHFDSHAQRDERAWLLGTNSNLKQDAVLRWVRAVPAEFHARFEARARHYRYTILNRDTRPALRRNIITAERRPLDAASMHKAAQALVGEHDFSAFRAAGCQAKSPIRRISWLTVARHGEQIHIDVVANAFLHHMVRNIAGVLMAIGSGQRPQDWTETVLQTRDRTQGGITAPANGLSLMGVRYPDAFDIPVNPESQALFAAIGV